MDPIRNTLRSRGPDRYLHVFIGNLLPFQLLQDHHDLLGGESAIKILSPASHLLLTSHTSPHVWWLMCLLMLVVVLHDLMHLTFFGTWRWIFQQASFCLVLQFPKLCLDSRGMRRCPVKRPLQCTVHLHSSHNNLTNMLHCDALYLFPSNMCACWSDSMLDTSLGLQCFICLLLFR